MEVRADVYLWAVRMYKSRSLATTAIKGGKVKVNDQPIKASHSVKIGERFTLMIGHTKKILEVVALTENRGSFDIARKHYIDHSPPPEKKDFMPSAFFSVNIKRERGSGRPTKKDRRDIDDFSSD
jgi:ribosome-associated heat shock protein Hsp15